MRWTPRSPVLGAAAALALLALAGCAGPAAQPLRRSGAEQREALAAARARAAVEPAEAARALEAFVARWPESPLADDAALDLAALENRLGRPDRAERWLRWVLAHHPQGDRADSARLRLARRLEHQGRVQEAWETARSLRLPLLSEHERSQAIALLVRLADRVGAWADELRWLERQRREAADAAARQALAQRTEALLARLAPAELEQAAEELGRRPPAGRVWRHAAEEWMRLGRIERARAALEQARSLASGPAERARLESLAERLARAEREREERALPVPYRVALARAASPPLPAPGAGGQPIALGVVLPLTGPLAWVGEESLRGVMLAAGIFGSPPQALPAPVRLLVRDTGGRPERAAEAVRELARRDEVAAVIGPLLAKESLAAAEVAERSGVPLLALTRHEEVARGRRHVFRFGLTVRREMAALAEYAVDALGLRRFAILYPHDRYGRELERAFWEAVESRGGRIAGVARYAPRATDFADPIRRLIGYLLLTPDERAAIEEREKMLALAKRLPADQAATLREEAKAMLGPDEQPLPPIVDFDAVFVPDSYETAALLAPQLAFHEVDGVRLLGTSGWLHPDLVRIGGRYVEGAVFPSPVDPASPFPSVQAFVAGYRKAFGEDPGRFAAEAFDTTRLALTGAPEGRAGVERALAAVRSYPGVSGVIDVLADGNARKRPFVLGVARHRIVSLE